MNRAVMRLFGAILIMLAALNAMLSWRAGMALNPLPVWMFAAGALLCLIGAARGRTGKDDTPDGRRTT